MNGVSVDRAFRSTKEVLSVERRLAGGRGESIESANGDERGDVSSAPPVVVSVEEAAGGRVIVLFVVLLAEATERAAVSFIAALTGGNNDDDEEAGAAEVDKAVDDGSGG